jgi:hypothetical protein
MTFSSRLQVTQTHVTNCGVGYDQLIFYPSMLDLSIEVRPLASPEAVSDYFFTPSPKLKAKTFMSNSGSKISSETDSGSQGVSAFVLYTVRRFNQVVRVKCLVCARHGVYPTQGFFLS